MKNKHPYDVKLHFCGIMTLLLTVFLWQTVSMKAAAAPRLQDTGEKTVIVIDPGHGGDNRGTIESTPDEKYMTLTTALAMYDELSKYDNVEIYLTRTADVDMELEERAEFAAGVDADFLFSIHYNASTSHELYGSEVWVSMFAPFNGYGMQFGNVLLPAMREEGLLIRGVKTRLGSEGEDYYGIIRYSIARGIPALIIEHCHVDEDHDKGYCDSEEDYKAFGVMDATAVAKYFGLSSTQLGVDYSDYSLVEASASSMNSLTRYDETDPDVCQISLKSADYGSGTLSLKVEAADYDTPLLYYSYSLNGGEAFSPREPWPECDTLTGTYRDTFTLDLTIPAGVTPEVVLRVYNPYDLYADSNVLTGLRTFTGEGSGTGQNSEAGQASGAGQDAGKQVSDRESVPQEIPAAGDGQGTPGQGISGQDASGQGSAAQTSGSGSVDSGAALPALSENAEENEALHQEEEISFLDFLKICLVIVILLFLIILVSQGIYYHNRRKRRRQHRNDVLAKRNHPR